MNNITAQYMAGVIDSDGSFSLIKRKRQTTIKGFHYRSIFQLTWKKSLLSEEVMKDIVKQYGGAFYVWDRKPNQFDKKHSTCFKYSIEGFGLEKLVEDTIPYLRLKKEQAIMIKRFKEIRRNWRKLKTRNKPELVCQEEDLIYKRFTEINTKNGKS